MDTETSDQELVAACVAGDVRAFGRLVERHHGAVAAVAFAITRDLALSEDVAQDAFVVAWTHLRELRDSQRVRAWLCGIARNLSKTELRSRRRDVADVDAIRDDAADAHSLIEAAEAERVLHGALDDLPATYREPLVLFYWQDHSIEHVASALEISAQAAQKRISRARTMIGAELAARLDKTARDRRPAKAAAASIVAILATRGAPASAAVARTAARSMKSLGLVAIEMAAVVVACAVLSVLAWNGLTSSSDASAAPRGETATAVERTTSSTTPVHAPSAPSAPALPKSPTAKTADVSTGSFGNPSSYELTELAPTRVAVALAGGQSSVYLWEQPPAPTMTRHVKGHVLDAAGKPVAGAVVVIDTKLAVMFDSFTGGGGAVTNAAGEFDVAMHADDAFFAVALHARAGWSAPVPVARGAGDAEIELRIPGGGMSGNVTRAGAPIEADIQVKVGSSFMLMMKTDPKGHFELPLLAPGTYHVTAHPTQLIAGGTGRGAEQDVTVGGGKPIAVALEVPTGTLIVASFDAPQKLSTVEYWLVPGEISDTPDVRDLKARGRDGKLLDYLVGGVDADREVQFHDIAAGKYTVCVEGKLDRDHPLPLVCKALEIRANVQVVTVSIKN